MSTFGVFKKPKIRFRPTQGSEYEPWVKKDFYDCVEINAKLVNPRDDKYAYYPHIGPANMEKYSGRLLDYKLVKDEDLISGKYEFNEDEIVYGKINPQFGKVVFPRFKGLCSADSYPITAKKDVILPDFLFQLLLSTKFLKYTTSVSMRTGMPKINREELGGYSFYLPSLEEQQKIASFFSLLDQKIEKQREKTEQLELFKKGMIQKIFSQEIRFKDENGQVFPEWETAHLGDLGSFIKSYSFSRNMEGEGEYQHIHYGDIHSKFSGIILSQTEIPSLIIDSDSSYTLLEDGDVIFADASEDTSDLGKSVVLLEVDNRKIIGGLHTLCFRPDNRLDSLFLHFFTQTDEYRKFIKANANGVSVYGLSKPALSSLEIPLPDIKEQIKISSFLYNLSRKIELLKRKKMELEEMKRGFMSQMFV